MLDDEFFGKANRIRDPLTGTEIMAPILYNYIRSIRPQNVLEYGMGYSTIFILQALSDNLKSFHEEKKALINKCSSFPSPISPEDFNKWFFDKNAPFYDPSYYMKNYAPQLICFEKLPKSHRYTQTVLEVIESLNLIPFLTLIEGDACTESELIPKAFLPLDFIWNDDDSYYKFYKTYWKLLNNNDAYLLYHSTESTTSLGNSEMEKIKLALQNEKGSEIISIIEPHKLHQRSFTIIRKKGNKPQINFDIPAHQKNIYENFLLFKKSHST